MTQMEPEEGSCEGSSDDGDEGKMPSVNNATKRKEVEPTTVHAYGEHLRVEQSESTSRRRYQQMAKEQKTVVRVDQKAYDRAYSREIGGWAGSSGWSPPSPPSLRRKRRAMVGLCQFYGPGGACCQGGSGVRLPPLPSSGEHAADRGLP